MAMMMTGRKVSRKLQKEEIVARSKSKVENFNSCSGVVAVIWIRRVLKAIGVENDVDLETVAQLDNHGGIHFAKIDFVDTRTKEIDVRYNYRIQEVQRKQYGLMYGAKVYIFGIEKTKLSRKPKLVHFAQMM